MGETVNIKTREAMQSLNLAYCELVSFLVCQPQQLSQSLKRRARPRKSGDGLSDESSRKQVHEVAAYVVKCLRGELGSITGLPSALSLKAYTTLLPTLWALRAEQEILSTVLQHATFTTGGDKATKRIAVEFTGRIVLLDSDPLCITSVGLDKELVNEWVLALPRAAWELGEKDPRGSEVRYTFKSKDI
ncbi:hypothetical protein FRC12_010670 [Ceratobasidium sp. 428]|nr:hypothetical protein FRC12_010670 [Ceratobasidium sp. 428]